MSAKDGEPVLYPFPKHIHPEIGRGKLNCHRIEKYLTT